jgi:hypothetical protein
MERRPTTMNGPALRVIRDGRTTNSFTISINMRSIALTLSILWLAWRTVAWMDLFPVRIQLVCNILSLMDQQLVGHSIWTSPMTHAFVEACNTIGIPISPDVNTSTGSLGATRVSLL